MHIYTNSEKKIMLPSVTTITSFVKFKPEYESLILWANSLGFQRKGYKDTLNIAADFGTYVHEAISHIVNNESVPTDIRGKIFFEDIDKYDRSINNFIKFYNETKPETIYSEKSLLSEKLGYGGTIDWVSRENGCTYITDFKTSSAVRPYMAMQLAAYIELLKEIDVKIDKARILLVSKPTIVVHEFTEKEISDAYELFTRILFLYNEYGKENQEDVNENSLIIV
jgi:hypothetical protein